MPDLAVDEQVIGANADHDNDGDHVHIRKESDFKDERVQEISGDERPEDGEEGHEGDKNGCGVGPHGQEDEAPTQTQPH